MPRHVRERISVEEQQAGAFAAVAQIDLHFRIARLDGGMRKAFEHGCAPQEFQGTVTLHELALPDQRFTIWAVSRGRGGFC